MTAVLEGVMSAFDTDTVGDVQLARFQPLLSVFRDEAEKDMVEGLPNFQQDVDLQGGRDVRLRFGLQRSGRRARLRIQPALHDLRHACRERHSDPALPTPRPRLL